MAGSRAFSFDSRKPYEKAFEIECLRFEINP